jgi:tRNA threonylcarbamoyladenosine biosynthesis protein TsaE
MKIDISDLKTIKSLACKLAAMVKIGDVIELCGDLGSGKTTFSKFFINSLTSEKIDVLSPTFNLVYPYDTKDFTIWHYDLYRLKNANEIEELGIYDAFNEGVCLIEWPEIIEDILPEDRLKLNLLYEGCERHVVIIGYGLWKERIMGLDL